MHSLAYHCELEHTKVVIREVISRGIILNEMHGCISNIFIHVQVAPPIPVGASSMALWLRQRIECYYYHPCAGLNVVEVAHEIHLPISKFITDSLALINSFDTWHGELIFPLFYYSVMYQEIKMWTSK